MFATFINFSVSTISARRLCANSSGVLGMTAAPLASSFFAHLRRRKRLCQRVAHLLYHRRGRSLRQGRPAGLLRACWIWPLLRSTTGRGVLAGAKEASHSVLTRSASLAP
jgi:hypothetical protein